MSKFQELQAKHLELVSRYEQDQASADLLADVQTYVTQVQLAGNEIGDSRERNQLRANLRFWGAYLYDHTGTYPNLNLLPSETGTAVPASLPKAANRRWILFASLGLLGLIFLVGLFNINRLFPPAATEDPALTSSFVTPISTVENSMSQVEGFASQTALAELMTAEASTFTIPITAPSDTPIVFDTLFPTPTPVALDTVTPTTTPVSFLTPVTGGGGGASVHAFASIEIQNESLCSNHRINIKMKVYPSFAPDDPVAPAVLSVREEGAFRKVEEKEIPLRASDRQDDTDEIDTAIDIPDASGSYLIYIDHPVFTFDTVIVQHLPGCQGNHTDITYNVPTEWYQEFEARPNLGIEFSLLAWGPAPTSKQVIPYFAVAKLQVSSLRNNGDSIFWIADGSENYQVLQDNKFVVSSSTQYFVGVTSGGRTVSIPFYLQAPYKDFPRNE